MQYEHSMNIDAVYALVSALLSHVQCMLLVQVILVTSTSRLQTPFIECSVPTMKLMSMLRLQSVINS